METNNKSSQQFADNSMSVIKNHGDEHASKTSFLQRKESMIAKHVEEMANSNKSWLSRMMLNKDDKMLLREYGERQQEAVHIILSNQNKALGAISAGHVTMTKELVNTLLKTGRAGLKFNADVFFTELRNKRGIKMEEESVIFYDLMETKLADAARRQPPLQEMKMREVEMDMRSWEESYRKLLEEFGNILIEQV